MQKYHVRKGREGRKVSSQSNLVYWVMLCTALHLHDRLEVHSKVNRRLQWFLLLICSYLWKCRCALSFFGISYYIFCTVFFTNIIAFKFHRWRHNYIETSFYGLKWKNCYFLVQQKNNQIMKSIRNRLKDKQKLIHEQEQVISGKVSIHGGGVIC